MTNRKHVVYGQSSIVYKHSAKFIKRSDKYQDVEHKIQHIIQRLSCCCQIYKGQRVPANLETSKNGRITTIFIHYTNSLPFPSQSLYNVTHHWHQCWCSVIAFYVCHLMVIHVTWPSGEISAQTSCQAQGEPTALSSFIKFFSSCVVSWCICIIMWVE